MWVGTSALGCCDMNNLHGMAASGLWMYMDTTAGSVHENMTTAAAAHNLVLAPAVPMLANSGVIASAYMHCVGLSNYTMKACAWDIATAEALKLNPRGVV